MEKSKIKFSDKKTKGKSLLIAFKNQNLLFLNANSRKQKFALLLFLFLVIPIVSIRSLEISDAMLFDKKSRIGIDLSIESINGKSVIYKKTLFEFYVQVIFDYTDYAIGGELFSISIFIDSTDQIGFTNYISVPEYSNITTINQYERIIVYSFNPSYYSTGSHNITAKLKLDDHEILDDVYFWTREEQFTFQKWWLVLLFVPLILIIVLVFQKSRKKRRS